MATNECNVSRSQFRHGDDSVSMLCCEHVFLCCVGLRCAVLCCEVMRCVVLCCELLCCIGLCFDVLCCDLMCGAVL